MTGKRLVLGAIAVLLSLAAALAIGILLFGDFGEREGRILATTAILAGYGVLALPGAILYDRGRLLPLAFALLGLALGAAALNVFAIWAEDVSEPVQKALGTATIWLLVAVQVAALSLRRQAADPGSVRILFAVSTLVAFAAAALLTGILWSELDSERAFRILGALVVLDVLLVALQPLLARVRPSVGPPEAKTASPARKPEERERERLLR